MVDLKSCPFCGGSTFTLYTEDTRHLNSVVTWHHIRCDAPACAAEMRYPSEEGAIAAWNRRALATKPAVKDDETVVEARAGLCDWIENEVGAELPFDARAALAGSDSGWRAMAKPLDAWHEDDGFVTWWTWRDGQWLGEPSYIGSPLCSDWPGYHTHWTKHPDFPAAPQQGGE